MKINKRFAFYSASAAAALGILAIKNELSIKMLETPEIAIENGISIIENHLKVLAISAHPDDLEFFAGGLLRLMSLKGNEIHIIDVTDGEKGVRLRNLAQTRRREQLAAGRVLGIRHIHFLHLPDLKLDQVSTLDHIISKHIREIKPDIVLTFDCCKPIKIIVHPDHMKVGESTKEAIKQQTDKKPILLYYASREPNLIVDITDCVRDKISAVRQHRSQIRFSSRPYGFFVKAFARYSSLNTGIKYAEGFRQEITTDKN